MSPLHELLAHDITCPYCWETINITLDASVPEQEYVEDCQVCCNPIDLKITIDERGQAVVMALNPED